MVKPNVLFVDQHPSLPGIKAFWPSLSAQTLFTSELPPKTCYERMVILGNAEYVMAAAALQSLLPDLNTIWHCK